MTENQVAHQIVEWYRAAIGASELWAAVGFVAVILVSLLMLTLVIRASLSIFGAIGRSMAVRRRKQTLGYCIGLAPLAGPKGKPVTKALLTTLSEDLRLFSFGAPYELVEVRAPISTRRLGTTEVARRWLAKASADMIVWGQREQGGQTPFKIDILSCEGSLTPAEARQSRVLLSHDFHRAEPSARRVGAYLIARALQPGLATATAFRAERLEPVANILSECLANPGNLPDETLALLETDYCAMALHIASDTHLDRVASLRRRRLSSSNRIDTQTQILARIDLGRALLAISARRFDPARVREAMDHLKAGIELLRQNTTIQLASQTTAAVQQGQAMLSARQRFSVTGGSI